MPNRGNQRNRAFGCGANDDFLIEGHKVFQAAAAARHNQHIGARHGATFRQGGKTPDGGGNLFRRALALHRDGPKQDMARKAARDGGADILNDRAFFAGDHANHARQKGQGALAAFVE